MTSAHPPVHTRNHDALDYLLGVDKPAFGQDFDQMHDDIQKNFELAIIHMVSTSSCLSQLASLRSVPPAQLPRAGAQASAPFSH